MSRALIITCGEGQTGHLIADLLLTNEKFSSTIKSLHVATCNTEHEHIKSLSSGGASIIPVTPGDTEGLTKSLKDSGADTICIIPPSVKKKLEASKEMVEASKAAGIKNVVLISSAGCDMAEREKQPRLREFVDIENLVMKTKGEKDTETGHSPCIIRAGFYAENLLLYNKQAKDRGKLPLPMGPDHKFAPVALGDIALLAAHVLTSSGEHGLGDNVRGQLMTLTGPMMAAGNELAEAASQGLGTKMEYEDISEFNAKKLLQEAEISDAEKEYLMEYYTLVREGKTNYISTNAFHDVTGAHPMEMTEFFKTYAEEFKPKKRKTKK
ncbi:NAD(P)-binding protein [Wilcoxina mikolae CBS 423.85]|nr:NAD(P)-binding protein [Wilcoxina mikolae CBS 423.85]